jgi:hypothetical protein
MVKFNREAELFANENHGSAKQKLPLVSSAPRGNRPIFFAFFFCHCLLS